MDILCALDVDQPALSIGDDDEKDAPGGLFLEEAFYDFVLLKSNVVFGAIESRLGLFSMQRVISSLHTFLENIFGGLEDGKGEDENVSTPVEETDINVDHIQCRGDSPSNGNGNVLLGDNQAGSVVVDHVTTGHFVRLAKKISGKDLRGFIDQWVMLPGIAHLACSFMFNRKKGAIELTINQKTHHVNQSVKFCGPLRIRCQETDRSYDHYVHIEEEAHTFDLPYHAKYKKPKKRFGDDDNDAMDEIDDSASMDASKVESLEEPSIDSPILWMRIDPEMEWIRMIELSQPDFMWMEQLDKDKDVISQAEVTS